MSIEIEKLIPAKEFFSMPNMQVGQGGDERNIKLTAQTLEKEGFDVFFIDNPRDRGYSDTMYFKPKKKSSKVSVKLLTMLVGLRPDECSVEPTGLVRMWWD